MTLPLQASVSVPWSEPRVEKQAPGVSVAPDHCLPAACLGDLVTLKVHQKTYFKFNICTCIKHKNRQKILFSQSLVY